MAEHQLTLTAAEDLVLLYWLEGVNAQRLREHDQNDQPLPAFVTVGELLHWCVRNDLMKQYRALNDTTQELLAIAQAMTGAQRTVLLSKLPDGPRKTWLLFRLQGG